MFYKEDELHWLTDLAHSWGLAEALRKQQALFAWRQAVGPQLVRWARPLYVSRGALHLAVGSYVAASQIRLLELKLVDALQRVAPDCGVHRLQLHMEPESPRHVEQSEAKVTADDYAAADRVIPCNIPLQLRERLVAAAARAQAQERVVLEMGGRRCASCRVAFLGEGTLCKLCSLVGPEEGD